MTENEIGERLLGCALKVHRALGPGLLENAYEACLSYEFSKAGIEHQRQLALPIVYEGTRIDLGYRLDLLVQEKVVVEVKAVAALTDAPGSVAQLSEARRLSSWLPARLQRQDAQGRHLPPGQRPVAQAGSLRVAQRSPRLIPSNATGS